ncbi:TPA: hypothetical protein U2I12_004756, partial [Citrobacter farmeri]|nr:hypothetical protein [Citrobacter farmeri]
IQYGKRINRRGIVFTLMLSAFIWSCLPTSALAGTVVHHGNGLETNPDHGYLCAIGGDFIQTGSKPDIGGNVCNIMFGDVYVPKAGMYFIRFYVGLRGNHAVRDYADSEKFYLDATKTLAEQGGSVSLTTYNKALGSQFANTTVDYCDVLVDAQGAEYSLVEGDACA